MKKMHLTAIVGAALAAVLLLAPAQTPAFGQSVPGPAAGQNARGRRIEGTWRVETTSRDCQSGEAGATVQALNTFLAGGSMLSDPAVNPAVLRTGHGVWEHVGGQSFTNTVVLFRFINGTFAGTVTVRRMIELGENADEFTSTDSAEIADPGGNVILTRCETSVGRRL